jgi:hypothetical protein
MQNLRRQRRVKLPAAEIERKKIAAPFRVDASRNAGARTYHKPPPSHKTCIFARVPLLSAIETGLQSRWVINAG